MELTKEQIQTIEKKYNIMLLIHDDYIMVFYNNKINTIKRIKKEDINWINNRIEKILNEKNNNLRSFFNDNISVTGNYYFTSFGFSFDTLSFDRKQFDNDVNKISKLLDNNNIIYRCELSNAGWVYRFILSQSKENLYQIGRI